MSADTGTRAAWRQLAADTYVLKTRAGDGGHVLAWVVETPSAHAWQWQTITMPRDVWVTAQSRRAAQRQVRHALRMLAYRPSAQNG